MPRTYNIVEYDTRYDHDFDVIPYNITLTAEIVTFRLTMDAPVGVLIPENDERWNYDGHQYEKQVRVDVTGLKYEYLDKFNHDLSGYVDEVRYRGSARVRWPGENRRINYRINHALDVVEDLLEDEKVVHDRDELLSLRIFLRENFDRDKAVMYQKAITRLNGVIKYAREDIAKMNEQLSEMPAENIISVEW